MCTFRAKKSSSSWSIAANLGDALVWLTGKSGDPPADALKASLSNRDCSVFSAWNIGLKIVRAAKARRLILVLLASLAIAMSQAQESHNDPPGRVGRISYLDGKVSFLPAGQGWTWIEAEPWGFCPFHFGRWVHIGVAWGWVPGPIPVAPIYSPAFVAFVGGSGVSVSVGVNWVGWFPLGPVEPFFPWYYHTDNYLRIINVTNIRNVTNIENIIHVTNINQVHYAYRSIATTAVPLDVFSRGLPVASHALRLPPAQLARAPIIPHPPVNPAATAAAPGRPRCASAARASGRRKP